MISKSRYVDIRFFVKYHTNILKYFQTDTDLLTSRSVSKNSLESSPRSSPSKPCKRYNYESFHWVFFGISIRVYLACPIP